MPNSGTRYHAFVDWDDTLKVTNAMYHAASACNAGLLLAHVPGCQLLPKDIEARVHVIDLAKSKQHGLRQSNFAEAWVAVYATLAAEYGNQTDPTVVQTLYTTAAAVPTMPQEDYQGARELLDTLRKMGCEITIWTAGEQAVQEGKIDRSGYRSMVDRVWVTPEKTPGTLSAALGDRDPAATCVIGNSPRSDIAPALELGVWAVHVLQDTWAYDDAHLDVDHPRYISVATLSEVQRALPVMFPQAFSEQWKAPA